MKSKFAMLWYESKMREDQIEDLLSVPFNKRGAYRQIINPLPSLSLLKVVDERGENGNSMGKGVQYFGSDTLFGFDDVCWYLGEVYQDPSMLIYNNIQQQNQHHCIFIYFIILNF